MPAANPVTGDIVPLAAVPATSDGPALNAVVITPSDTTPLAVNTRGLYIGAAGNVSVQLVGGQNVLFSNVPVGVLPVCVRQVFNTGTTAGNIMGMS